MIQYNCYEFRIYPTAEQEHQLYKTVGCARKVYNELLSKRQKNYELYSKGKITKKELKSRDKSVQYSALKKDFPFLKDVDSLALAHSKKNLDTAFKRFFEGTSEYPTFKKKNSSKWSYTTCVASKGATNLRLTKDGLKVPKVKDPIRIVVHRNPKGILKSATIRKDKDHRWFVSLKFEQKVPKPVFLDRIDLTQKHNYGAGDLGIKDLITLSNGMVFGNPKFAREDSKALAKAQKIMARRKEQAFKDGKKLSAAKNYQKAKKKVARIHSRIARKRKDYLHKVTSFLSELFQVFVLEDLSSEDMAKNHSLAFSVYDVSWCKFTTFLEYKMRRKGGTVVYVDRFFASTQICSCCKSKTGPKGMGDLSVRQWTCGNCGASHNRDENAAKNILDEGLDVLQEFFDRWDSGSLEKLSAVSSDDVRQKETVVSYSREKDHNRSEVCSVSPMLCEAPASSNISC